jgi:SAM-dependent methyltransferase
MSENRTGTLKNEGASGSVYALGHTDQELERLQVQARLIEPMTRRWFLEAGIDAGMRVLDVGSGVGDVAMLVAELVGSSGEVVGTDRSSTPLAVAADRARAASLQNVHFVQGDPCGMAFGEPFDAVVGRYVLMFQPNPAQMVRALTKHLRPGGVVVFHEPYREALRSFPSVPTYDWGWQLVNDAFLGTGADPSMGLKLHPTFVAAGLPTPTMRMESLIAGGSGCWDNIEFEVGPVRSLLSEIVSLGLTTESEIDVDTLADRVHNELVTTESVILGRAEIAAWSRLEV